MANRKKHTETVDAETGEITEHPAPAVPAVVKTNGGFVLPGGKEFTVIRKVTRTLLKHRDGETVFVTVVEPIHVGKEIKGAKMAAADLMTVIDLTTGHEHDYIVNTVLHGVLDETYQKNAYVGKSFAIFRMPPDEGRGKKYATFAVTEIEPRS
jgi:hypothetical protein